MRGSVVTPKHQYHIGREEQILRDIKDGKKEAKRRLYDRYSGMAMSVCMRYMGNRDDAADVLQETFIKVLTRIGEVSYRGEGTLKSWILRVTVNEALTALRRKVYFDDVETMADVPETEEPDVEKVPLQVMMNMIARLPDGYRTVFNMFVMERMGHKEIARQLGIGVSSSASQLLRAKRILAKEINDYIKQTDR